MTSASTLALSGRRIACAATIATLALGSAGCVRHEVVHYTPLTWELDGKSELHISSYASWFPSETSHVPFLYKTIRTPESIYFQVFIRDAERKAGPNPHVRTGHIHSFDYRQPGRPAVQLIADYDRNFWMQNQPQYNPNKSEPVPCNIGQSIEVSIALELNGVDFAFDGEMTCQERRSTGSLLADAMAR